MDDKTELYAGQIHPLVEQITDLCRLNNLPMLMAFCLDRKDVGDGKNEMVVAGNVHLEPHERPPQPMVLAATMLRIPGFDLMSFDTVVGDIW